VTAPVADRGTIVLTPEQKAVLVREKALRVREAMLFLIRSWEEMYDLPRAVPTKRERDG